MISKSYWYLQIFEMWYSDIQILKAANLFNVEINLSILYNMIIQYIILTIEYIYLFISRYFITKY